MTGAPTLPDAAANWKYNDACFIDFMFGVNDGLHGNWGARGRATDMGHAEYAEHGSDLRQPKRCPFATAEEVWAFDPAAEYGLPDFGEQVKAYEQAYRATAEQYPEQLNTGGYYKTIVSGTIQSFGWEMLLIAAAEPEKMEKVFDRFFRFTLHHMKAWAETSAPVIIQHDDFVWTEGPFMDPEIYRKVIIPRYAELWKPLHAAGKKVLFCSDGTFTMFVDDLVRAGADGFIFEPTNDFGWMVDRVGATHCLVGSYADCRDMAFRSWDVVKETVDRTLSKARQCKGLVLAVGNHIPANVPDEMLDLYLKYVSTHWGR
jgi:hypothetical protein